MRKITITLGCLFCLIFSLPLSGQVDTLFFETVEVVAPPIRKDNLGGNMDRWTAKQLQQSGAQNLGDLLEQESGVFIKSYGLGSLATPSVRGGSAGHTQVLWNGMPIQSPMLGLVDFALLPISFVDEISLSRGGNTAQWGSGAIGGVINLENTNDFAQENAVSATTNFGSFGHFQQELCLDAGLDNWFSKTRLLYTQADNDFSYSIAPSLPERKQSNAALVQKGLQQSFYLLLPKQQTLAAHLWLQSTNRQIPPTITQNKSLAYEEDQAVRFVASYEKHHLKGKTEAKLGFAREDLDYFDGINQIEALSYFNKWLGEFTHQYIYKKHHHFLIGATHIFSTAEADGYQDGRTENRTAVFASYRWQQAKWVIQTSLRQALVDSKTVPLVPMIAMEGRLRNWLTLKAKLSRNYRLPTLNDRYWQPGGNPDLLPEQGWSSEATLQSQWQHKTLFWRYTITGFNRTIDDWILWSRPEGQQFWSSYNIAKVWSRGIEQRASISYSTKEWDIRLNLGYHYVRSTNQMALELPRIEKGSQLWYVPEHQGSSQLQVRWEKLSWNYQHQWTSNYTGTIGQLAAYQTASTRLQYDWQWQKLSGFIFFQVYNLWDENYQVIERRPMPGRYFRTGMHLKIGGS